MGWDMVGYAVDAWMVMGERVGGLAVAGKEGRN